MLWIGAGLGVAGAYLCWRRPDWAWWWVLTWSVGLEVIHHWYQGVGQYLPFAGGAVGAVLGVGLSPEMLGALRHARGRIVLFVLYVLSIGLSTLVSINLPLSARYVLGVPVVLWLTALTLPVLMARGKLTLHHILAGLAGAGVVLSLTAGIAATGFHAGFPVPVGQRVLLAWQWPFANKNTLGMLIMYALPAAVGLSADPGAKPKARWVWGVASVWLFLALMLSYARTAWIAGAAGVAMVLLLRFGKKAFLALLGGGAALVGVAVAVTGIKRWQHLWAKGLNGRVGLWQAALTVLRHRPLLGTGPGTSPAAIRPYVAPAFAGLTPHDTLLRTAVELGAVGLVIWVLLAAGALYRLWFSQPARRYYLVRVLGAVMVASLVEQMAESLLLGGVSFGDFFFTLLVGLGWMLGVILPAQGVLDRDKAVGESPN